MNVCVAHNSPRSLWSPPGSQARSNACSSELGKPSAGRAGSFFEVGSADLWKWSEYLALERSLSASGLKSVVWPVGLKHFVHGSGAVAGVLVEHVRK